MDSLDKINSSSATKDSSKDKKEISEHQEIMWLTGC
jgi:hypothetical protein